MWVEVSKLSRTEWRPNQIIDQTAAAVGVGAASVVAVVAEVAAEDSVEGVAEAATVEASIVEVDLLDEEAGAEATVEAATCRSILNLHDSRRQILEAVTSLMLALRHSASAAQRILDSTLTYSFLHCCSVDVAYAQVRTVLVVHTRRVKKVGIAFTLTQMNTFHSLNVDCNVVDRLQRVESSVLHRSRLSEPMHHRKVELHPSNPRFVI